MVTASYISWDTYNTMAAYPYIRIIIFFIHNLYWTNVHIILCMYLNLNYLTSENVAKDTSEYIVTVVVVKDEK